MTRVKFIFKLLIALLGPAVLAFALLRGWAEFSKPNPYSEGDLFSGQTFFELLIFGLLLLSIALPILLTIRDIQNERSAGGSPSLSTMIKTPTDKLWK